MLTVHYTIHERKDVAAGFTVKHEGNHAQAVINALVCQLGWLGNLVLPHHSVDLGVTVTEVTSSDNSLVIITVEAPNV